MKFLILGLLLMGAPVLACPNLDDAQPFRAATNDAPRLYYQPIEPPISEPFDLILVLCDAQKTVELKFDAIMPAHQHGMNYAASVAPIDANQFSVSNVVFHMPGLWEMQVTLDETHRYSAEIQVQ